MAKPPTGVPPFLRRVIARYVRSFAPDRIVLFGSYPKGMSHTRSDVDLLIVADVGSNATAQLRRARQLAADCFPPVDVQFVTPEEIASAATAPSPFLSSILGSGVTVYERPLLSKPFNASIGDVPAGLDST